MEQQKVGMREFRDNMATYMESETPVTITRHGDAVGLYIPLRHKRTVADRVALQEATEAFQQEMARVGLTEDEMLEDFKKWRKSKSK
jgi:PHD/YefM family antitoxin component YafN of YafNO toxin-antitoxin module